MPSVQNIVDHLPSLKAPTLVGAAVFGSALATAILAEATGDAMIAIMLMLVLLVTAIAVVAPVAAAGGRRQLG